MSTQKAELMAALENVEFLAALEKELDVYAPHIAHWNSPVWKSSSIYIGGEIQETAAPSPTPQLGPERCPFCGIKIFPDDRYCPGCGAPA